MLFMATTKTSTGVKTFTVSVYTRHSADCQHKSKGGDFRKCKCPKWLYIYDGKDTARSAKTRSWEDAEQQAQVIRDANDPVKLELMSLKQERQKQLVTFDDAVQTYFGDLRSSGTSEVTINNYSQVIGDTSRRGHLFQGGALPRWITRYNSSPECWPKLRYLSDINTDILLKWRTAWPKEYKWGDYTSYQHWLAIRIFFKWCHDHGYLTENPAKRLRPLKVNQGSRTGIFTDQQIEKIMNACDQYADLADDSMENQLRTKAFVLVMRWGAMAMSDTINLRIDQIDDDAVLRYPRMKLHGRGRPAEVQLPEFVVKALYEMPLADGTIPGHYFRISTLHAERKKWESRLNYLFKIAHIGKVQTEVRLRAPHSHMFRDTFAVWCIMNDVPLHEISKMLGHTKTAITEKAYLPWVEKRKHKMHGRMKELYGDKPKKK